jgi:hypothetical protein
MFLYIQLQQVSFSFSRISFKSLFEGLPRVHVNCLNIIFIGDMCEPCCRYPCDMSIEKIT